MEKDIFNKKALKSIREKKNTQDLEESRLNFNEDSDVFTKEVKPLSSFEYFLGVCKNLCIKIASFIWSWIVTIGLAIVNIFVSVYKFVRYGSVKIGKFFADLGHKFKYNDKYGRLSFFIFGAGSLAHKQYINGIMYLLFEIGYILFFIFVGVDALSGIWNLGVIRVDPNWAYNDSAPNFKYIVDNSLLLLITGLFVLLTMFIFIFIWYKSINAGYNNYRISKFNEYKNIHEKTMLMSNKIDEFVKGQYEAFYNQKGEKLLNEIDSEIDFNHVYNDYFGSHLSLSNSNIKSELNSLLQEYLEKAENKFEISYTKYTFNESIKLANGYYKGYYNSLNKKEKFDFKYNFICEKHLAENELIKMSHDADKVDEILSEKLLKDKKSEHKFEDKSNGIAKSLSDKAKTHSSFVARLSRINYNTYAKHNEYFNVISKYNVDLKFYRAYKDLANFYENIGGNFENENSSNNEKKSNVINETQEKIVAIDNRYNEIYAKKDAILKNKEELKNALKEELKALRDQEVLDLSEYEINIKARIDELTTVGEFVFRKIDTSAMDATEIARTFFQERINKLDGQYNSFANDKLLKTLQKEEKKLLLKRSKNDIKYLKTNYTSDSYAKTETINKMLVDYDFDYNYARKHVELFVNPISETEIDERIAELESKKNDYINNHQSTKFVGKSKTFVEQIKSLFNDKFHITILTLPVLGAVIFCIIPLIFSILIAFTNYDKQHLIGVTPFSWTGFETFIKMFEGTDPIYGAIGEAIGSTFLWTFVWAIFATFTNYFLGIVIALMINKDGIKLKKLWRTLFVLTIAIPQFISLSTIAKMLQTGGMGVINNMYQSATGVSLGFAESVKNNALVTKIIIIIVNVWVGIPYTILSTTGILMNIPKDLYESSRIDGASPTTQFFKITMPYILFVTGPSLITNFIGNFNNFGVIFFLTGGAPKRVGDSLMAPGYTDLFITYIYTLVTGDTYKYYNVASALGIIIFIVCSFVSIIMYNKTGAVAKEDQFQ